MKERAENPEALETEVEENVKKIDYEDVVKYLKLKTCSQA